MGLSNRKTVMSMCENCGDIKRGLDWAQLTLDETHILRFRASVCLCGVALLDVEMVVPSDDRN